MFRARSLRVDYDDVTVGCCACRGTFCRRVRPPGVYRLRLVWGQGEM